MADNQESAAGAGKKKKLIVFGGIAVLLLILAGGGSWFALKSMGSDKAPEAAAAEPAAAAATVSKREAFYEALEPAFLANYSIGGRAHYLQLSLTALAREQAGIDALRQHMPLIRNRIVMLLSGEQFETLQTDQGRVALQQKLLAAIQEILTKETGKPGIEQVFFTNFVMQ